MDRRRFLVSSAGMFLPADVAALSPAGNESIQRARDAGLRALKPIRTDVEHGLELHANSIVIELYGFSPQSAYDGAAVRAAMEAGATDIELQDLMEDMEMTRPVIDGPERAEFIQAFRAAGVTGVFQNAGEESQAPLQIIKRLAHFTYLTDMMRDFVGRAVAPDDVLAAKRQNRVCLYFSANGVPLTQEWVSVEDELRYIQVFFQLGIRMMHLTYNRRNLIGDGCAEPSNAGLSDFGRRVVAEMNRVGIIVDVAHSGWRTSLEAAKASKQPVVASHAACAALNNHFRCKPDEVIRAIADSGGFMGICAIPGFLGRTGDIVAMLDHVDYVVKRFGVDHVAIATDVAYVSRAAEAEKKKIPPRRHPRDRWEYFWPIHSARPPEQALTTAWTNWPLFTVGLVQRGYSDEDIRKIIGGNALRVMRAVLPPRVEGL